MEARQLATLLVRALGDVPGHEFHGNQWIAGSADEWLQEHTLGTSYPTPSESVRQELHQYIPKNVVTLYRAADPSEPRGVPDRPVSWTHDKKLAEFFVNEHFTGRQLRSKQFEPRHILVDTTLLPNSFKGKIASQSEVIVWKHAAGTPKALGDVPGHAFHGNQWTHGVGGNEWRKIDRHEGTVLNNVAMHTEHAPDFSQSVNPAIHEPDLVVPKGKHVSAGVVMTEPDGRVWVVEPHNRYGGYRNTFPKGTVDEGESLQETAAREVWEETGLVTKITGHLVDVERSTSVARFYTGVRVGGAPWAAGKETHAVKLMPIHGKGAENNLKSVFGRETSDRKVLDALRNKLRTAGDVAGHEFHGNQWTSGLASYSVDASVPTKQRKMINEAVQFVAQGHEHASKIHVFVAPTGKGNTENPHGYTKRNIRIENGKPVRDLKGNLVHTGKYSVYISSKQRSTEDFVRTIAHEFEHVAQWERGEEPHEVGARSAGNKASQKFKTAGDVVGHEFHGNQWTSGAGTEHLKEIAANRAFYPIDQPNKLYAHMSSTEREKYLKDFRRVPDARKAGASELDERDITHLISTQKSIEVSQVKELIQDPSLADDPTDGPPLIITWHGKDVVGDGHHRIAAALLRGERKMEVEYLNLDAYLKKQKTLEFNPDQPRDDHGQWTSGGGHAVKDEEKSIAKDLGLPTTYHGQDSESRFAGYAVDNPLPQSKQLTHEQTKRLPIMVTGSSKDVNIADLKSTQDYIQPSAVKYYKEGLYMKSQPIVATIHGEDILLNGNHNVLAAKLRGEKTISVQHLGDFSHHADYIKKVDKKFEGLGDVAGHEFHGNQYTGGEATVAPQISGDWLKFKTNVGELEAKRTGNELQIREVKVSESARGTGEGKKLYRSIFEYAAKEGLIVRSDTAVSESADHVWAAMKREGYPVQRAADVEHDKELNKYYALKSMNVGGQTFKIRSGEPVWRLSTSKALGDLPGHEFYGNQYTGGWPEGLKNISGAKGSNPGGIYVDKHGQKWYVKRYNNPQQAQTEHIANAVYRAVGVEAPQSVLGEGGDYASKVISGEGTLAKVGITKDRANKILDGFAADVFLDNWDAVGTGHDNILISGDRAIRIDQGGTLTFRAQGAPKPEAGLEKIGEWESLVNQNHYYNAIFKAAGVKNGDALGERAAKQIDKIVEARPKGGWKELIDKVAPKADVSFRAKAARMLEARQKLLEQKRDQLRGVKALGDVEGHPFHGNQWTSGISSENAKLYSGHHIDARKIAAVTGQIIRGEKLDPVAFGATDQHVDAARELVTSVRNAQEHSKPLYRGIGSEDPIPALENLKVGDKITFDRTTSFSSSREYASYYSERHSGGGIGHNYELRTEGPIKSVPTDKMTGLDHQEHITHGRFEVVGIDEPKTGVLVKVPKSVTGGNREFYVTHGRSIRLRQVGVL